MKTVGVSPKLIASVVTAAATYLVTQQALELPAWAVVVCQVVLVGVAAYAASPGAVKVDAIETPQELRH